MVWRSSTALGACLALLVSCTAARADAPEPAGRTVVTPHRGPARAAFDTDRAVHVISADALREGQPRDPAQAIAELPGVHVQRTNPGAAAPMLRGFIGPQTLVLVDGVRVDSAISRTGPNQYAALVDPGLLGAIEVVLGPGSVLYGSDAMGGVIHYRTHDVAVEEGVGGAVDAGFASADTSVRWGGRLSGRSGGFGGWLGAGIRFRGDLRTGGGADVPASDFSQAGWGGRFAIDLGAGWDLTGGLLGDRLPGATRTDRLARGDVRRYDNERDLGWLRLAHDFGRGAALDHIQVTVAFQRLFEGVTRWRCPTDSDGAVSDRAGCARASADVIGPRTVNEDEALALSGDVQLVARPWAGRVHVAVGGDVRHEWIGSLRVDDAQARGTFSDGSRYLSGGGYVHVEGRPYVDAGTFELVLAGGARVAAAAVHAPAVPGVGDIDDTFLGVVGSGSVRALIGYRLNLYASVHQGFRAPNLAESTALGDTGSTFEVPNAGLRPERSDTLEIGAKLAYPAVRMSVAAFRTWLSDTIVREAATFEGAAQVDGDKDVFRRVNAGTGRYDGVELAFAMGPAAGLTLDVSAAWIDGEVTLRDVTEPPRRLPPLRGRLALTWDAPRAWWSLRLGAHLVWAAGQRALALGDRRDLRICADPDAPHALLRSCPGTSGWQRLDLVAGVTPIAGLHVDVHVENTLDARYREHGSGHDAPGRDVRLSVQYDF